MMRIWFLAGTADGKLDYGSFKEFLDMVHSINAKPFTAQAAHAAQTVSHGHFKLSCRSKLIVY